MAKIGIQGRWLTLFKRKNMNTHLTDISQQVFHYLLLSIHTLEEK